MNFESIIQTIGTANEYVLLSKIIAIFAILLFFYVVIKGFIKPFLFYYPFGKQAIYSDLPFVRMKKHTAIIAIHYPGFFLYRVWRNFFVYCSGVELLKKGFEELGESYIIYHPSTPQEFREIIKIKEANPVWIIGHGFQYGVSFRKERLHFEELKGLKNDFNKDYIMQLQCWGSKKLIDDLCEDPSKSFFTDRTRGFEENREFVIQTLEKMRKGEF